MLKLEKFRLGNEKCYDIKQSRFIYHNGIKTFRASGGLWRVYDVMKICSAAAFRKNFKKAWNFIIKEENS